MINVSRFNQSYFDKAFNSSYSIVEKDNFNKDDMIYIVEKYVSLKFDVSQYKIKNILEEWK